MNYISKNFILFLTGSFLLLNNIARAEIYSDDIAISQKTIKKDSKSEKKYEDVIKKYNKIKFHVGLTTICCGLAGMGLGVAVYEFKKDKAFSIVILLITTTVLYSLYETAKKNFMDINGITMKNVRAAKEAKKKIILKTNS